jgi:hypothetical protein
MTRWIRLAGTGAVVAALCAAPALAQIDWDTDGDGMWSETEFTESFEEFGNLDASGDSVLTEDEFEGYGGDGDLAGMDIDASGDLSEEEFESGVFSDYDADGSGVWEAEEQTAFGDDGLL